MQGLLQRRLHASRCFSVRPLGPSSPTTCFILHPMRPSPSTPAPASYHGRDAGIGALCCSPATGASAAPGGALSTVSEQQISGMAHFLDSLKYNGDGLVAVIAQHVDTGEVLLQAFADRAALSETMQTGLATFYSRSRKGRWCKGETSGHYIHVQGVFVDCDRDSIIYLSDPIGPSCHTGARTCWFSEAQLSQHDGTSSVHEHGAHDAAAHVPRTTLLRLEHTIQQRREVMESKTEVKPSWTSKLLSNPELLCKKIREEAGELCQTLEESEGKERAASEAADLLYHTMVLLNVQGVPIEDVLRVLRKRFSQSGIDEKAARPPKEVAH